MLLRLGGGFDCGKDATAAPVRRTGWPEHRHGSPCWWRSTPP